VDLADARFLVAGATGAVGSRTARGLVERGARVAVAGRDGDRLAALAAELDAPAVAFGARDPGSCRQAVRDAAERLGGLDGLVVAVGAAAFGPAQELDDDVARALFEVNVLGPMALVGETLRHVPEGGAVVVLSAVVADFPTADMAAYSAAKAALSAYLAATRRERRRSRTQVLDVRPPHMETGFSERPLAGTPPTVPPGVDVDELVARVLDALPDAKREIAWDLSARELVTR